MPKQADQKAKILYLLRILRERTDETHGPSTVSYTHLSPMVDLGSLVLLTSIFGVKVASLYVLVGLVVAVIGGTLIEKLRMEDSVADFIRSANHTAAPSAVMTKRERLRYAQTQMTATFRQVFPYILAGVAIGAVIHNWIPESWIEAALGLSLIHI